LDKLELVMGVHSDKHLLAVNGEILKRILSLRRDQDYLIHPKVFVKLAIKNVWMNEKDQRAKTLLEELL